MCPDVSTQRRRLFFKGRKVQTLQLLKKARPLRYLETSGNKYTVTQGHVPEQLTPHESVSQAYIIFEFLKIYIILIFSSYFVTGLRLGSTPLQSYVIAHVDQSVRQRERGRKKNCNLMFCQ
jgi:hypothetical protein